MRCLIAAYLLAAFGAVPASAQPPGSGARPPAQTGIVPGATVRTVRATPVRERPRGDSAVVGSVAAAETLEILARQGDWYEVLPPIDTRSKSAWRRGWIHVSFVVRQGGGQTGLNAPRGPGRLSVRAFGQLAGMIFSARDSFDVVAGGSFGRALGFGGQVGFPGGVFVQGAVNRYDEEGNLAVVSGDQVFRLETAHAVSVTPVLFSVGYREAGTARLVYYGGAGAGWYRLEERFRDAADQRTVRHQNVGYHVMGGAEFPVLPWVAIAGELQWSSVSGVLGDAGVSAAFGEDNLGGTTLAFKLLVGR